MNRALLLGLAMLVLGGVVWVLTAGLGAQGSVDSVERTRVIPPGAKADGSASSVAAAATGARTPVELVPPPKVRAAAAADTRADDVAPLAAPTPGALRVLGQVRVDGDALESDGATVRVYIGDPADSRSRSLGAVPVRAGEFHLDVAADVRARMGRNGASNGYLTCVLAAPGFEVTQAQSDVAVAVDDVLHVQLETETCGLLVVGRVVSASGAPVPAANVVVVDFGPLGQDVDRVELMSGPDGYFQVALARRGFVDAVAHHSSHGVVKVAAQSEAESALLDLGDLRLEPRGVISGRVLGCGRAPLGRHTIELHPVSEEASYRSHELRTDDEGRFRFACLDATAYRVWIAGVDRTDEEQPVVTPDALDLELLVPVPSARVTVVGAGGAPVPEIWLTVRPVQRVGDAWRVGGPGDSVVMDAEAQAGVFHVAFSHPGVYSIGAATTVDGVRWAAHERVEIGMEHRVLRLDLSPEARAMLVLEVTDPSGAHLPDWETSFIDSATGIVGGSSRMRKSVVALAPGTWTASVEPRGDTYVMPFQVEVHVTAEQDRLRLRATECGGRLTVRATWSASERSAVVANVQRAGGGPSFNLALADGAPATIPHPIPAGEYELTVPAERVDRFLSDLSTVGQSRRAPVTRALTIRPGETTFVHLSVP